MALHVMSTHEWEINHHCAELRAILKEMHGEHWDKYVEKELAWDKLVIYFRRWRQEDDAKIKSEQEVRDALMATAQSTGSLKNLSRLQRQILGAKYRTARGETLKQCQERQLRFDNERLKHRTTERDEVDGELADASVPPNCQASGHIPAPVAKGQTRAPPPWSPTPPTLQCRLLTAPVSSSGSHCANALSSPLLPLSKRGNCPRRDLQSSGRPPGPTSPQQQVSVPAPVRCPAAGQGPYAVLRLLPRPASAVEHALCTGG